KVEEKGKHFSTGNMGTKAMIEVLSQAGLDDLVYELMTTKTSPSFGYMLEQGATSMWERWEADRNNNIMNSRNHPMFSACSVWFYKYLGGIGMAPDTEAFSDLVIAPHTPEGLSHVEVEMDIPAGRVKTAWEKTTGAFVLNVCVPFNTKAWVLLPALGATVTLNGKVIQPELRDDGRLAVHVEAGNHELVVRAQ
ncbi:MAG: hypothetical protein LBT14_12320, partial [Treponema sp.]|nr:hypothetical protein [Treponema sp.]